MVKIRFVKIRGMYSFYSSRIDFGKKNLIVGPNDSGKSSIFKALNFFLKTLTEYSTPDKKPWDSQTDHKMTVGFTLDYVEKRYFMEILSVTDVAHSSSMFCLSASGITEHLMQKFDDVELTIKWFNRPFQYAGNVEYFLYIRNLGVTICSNGYNKDVWIVKKPKSQFNYASDSTSFSEAIENVGIKDENFVKEEFSNVFDQSLSIKIASFPDPTRFTDNSLQSGVLDSTNTIRINAIMELSGNRPQLSQQCSFFIMFGYLLESRFSFIAERRNFLESNDLERSSLKDDGSNLQSYLFWLQNSNMADERKKYSAIQKSFEDMMESQNLSFDLSIIEKVVKPEEGTVGGTRAKVYPDRVTVVFNDTLYGSSNSKNFTSVGGGIRETLFLLTKCMGQSNEIVLMDEPATNLHPTHIRSLMNKIFTFRNNIDESSQIIVITHSPVLANLGLLSSVDEIIRVDKMANSHIVQPSKKDKEWLADNLATFHQLKSDVLFAKGVMLVEGPSDRIFLENILGRSKEFDIAEGDITILEVGGFKSFPKFRRLVEIFDIPFVILADNGAQNRFEQEEIRGLNPTSVFQEGEDEVEQQKVYVLEKDLEGYLSSLNQNLYQETSTEYGTKPEIAYHFIKQLLVKKIPSEIQPVIFMINHLNRLSQAESGTL